MGKNELAGISFGLELVAGERFGISGQDDGAMGAAVLGGWECACTHEVSSGILHDCEGEILCDYWPPARSINVRWQVA